MLCLKFYRLVPASGENQTIWAPAFEIELSNALLGNYFLVWSDGDSTVVFVLILFSFWPLNMFDQI